MKIKQIITLLVGVTSVALTTPVWAAPHGGGGGGFSGGGGFRGGGGSRGGGGFRTGGFGAPNMSFGGTFNRGGGVGFGGYHPVPHVATGPTGVHSFVPSRSPVVRSSGSNPTRSLTNAGRVNRAGNTSGRTTAALNRTNNRGVMHSSARPSQTAPQRGLDGRTDHIAERHEANWHHDWDRRHAHFFHNRFFVFDDGFWFGLDDGFFPWDYLPYYADDYYPYDYYADSEPSDNTQPVDNNVPAADPTVQAVQSQLTELGYYNGPVDGVFGPATRDAVAKYQIANQLSVTGSLSPDTMQSLGIAGANGQFTTNTESQ